MLLLQTGMSEGCTLYFKKYSLWIKNMIKLSNNKFLTMGKNMKLLCDDTQHQPMTISQLSVALKQYVEKNFSAVYVQGEISGCKYHSSGHIYFTLKDAGSVLDAVCWRHLSPSFALKDGMSVVCWGRITTYSARSKYQLVIERIQQEGQGHLLRLIQELKEKLAKEGLFSQERKRTLPAFPQFIGLITSPTGAVIQDMWARFREKLPCRLCLYPVSVQGKNTISDILMALSYFHQLSPRPDLLIIARGGGSAEDLMPFHDESLIRAVAASEIPVISAIGHETDTTLLDYVADARALTPTAAAEMALPSLDSLYLCLKTHEQKILKNLSHIHILNSHSMQALHKRLGFFKNFTEAFDQKIDYLCENLCQNAQRFMDGIHYKMNFAIQGLKTCSIYKIDPFMQKVENLNFIMESSIKNMLAHQHSLLDGLHRLLDNLSYYKILTRGFALALDHNKQVVASKDKAIAHSHLTLHFYDGEVRVSVKDKA
jgi:exodeoxyribonuclease VII large subunit